MENTDYSLEDKTIPVKIKVGTEELTLAEVETKASEHYKSTGVDISTLTPEEKQKKIDEYVANPPSPIAAPDTSGLKVKIGGIEFTREDIEKKAAEYFATDLTKMDAATKERYVEAYLKKEHIDAWQGAYTKRDQEAAERMKNANAEVKQKLEELDRISTSMTLRNIEAKRSLEAIVNKDISGILEPDERSRAIAAQESAKLELGKLENKIVDDNKYIESQKANIQKTDQDRRATEIVKNLQESFPDLRTVETLEVIYAKIQNGLPVDESEKAKVLKVVNVLETVGRTGFDEITVYKSLYGNGTGVSAPVKKTYTPEEWNKLSAIEQYKYLKENQSSIPGSPPGSGVGAAVSQQAGSEDTRAKGLTEIGY